MQVAFVIDHYTPAKGGMEIWIGALADHLISRGHGLHLVSGDRRCEDDRFRHHPIRAQGLTRSATDRDFAERATMLTDAAEFDAVLGIRHLLACDVYAPHGGSVREAFDAHREAKGGPKWPARRVENFLRLERELLTGDRPPRKVLAVSRMVKGDLVRHYPDLADRIVVVPNGVDLDRFTPEGREEARASLGVAGPTGLFLAGNPRLKGWRFVRAAFERLRGDGVLEHLLVAGGDPGRLPDGARYLGTLPDPVDAYRAADVLLQPTYYDPFPLTTLESLACGTPVVTTERNGAVAHLSVRAVRAVPHPSDVDDLVEATKGALGECRREDARRAAEDLPLLRPLEVAAAMLLPDLDRPAAVRELVRVLTESRRLVSRPENDYSWSSWRDAARAVDEIDGIIRRLEADLPVEPVKVAVLFTVTGPMQEVSLSSGWGEEFLRLADEFDWAGRRMGWDVG
jgi:UDP-glucose:(heptosyl)LPS alpha-1,3-glucosyltransferase